MQQYLPAYTVVQQSSSSSVPSPSPTPSPLSSVPNVLSVAQHVEGTIQNYEHGQTSGIINGLKVIGGGSSIDSKSYMIIGGLMIMIGAFFGVLAVLDILYLVKVHALYRGTGASFSKAQEEFARGVVTNPGVQTATREAAASAVSGATTSMFSSGGGAGNNRM